MGNEVKALVMGLSQDEILQILELLEHAKDIEHLEIRIGEIHLVASRSGLGSLRPESAVPSGHVEPVSSVTPESLAGRTRESGSERSPAAASDKVDAHVASGEGGDDVGMVTVFAPLVGVFYRAPEPGANPFVQVGSIVDEDATVGLIEVMKMFSSIRAGVRGKIQAILASNEEFVEYGQPLFHIEPEVTG